VTVAVAALAALPASFLTIRGLLHTPAGRHVVAAPSADRWHTRSTPLLGGSGIFAGLLVAAGIALATGLIPAARELGGILGGCAILFAAGLADDLLHLPPLAKLGAQGAAAALVLVAGVRVEIVDNPVAATAIGVAWLVGMTNAFNLLDNMDGLAATLAAIACAFFAIDAYTVHPSHLVALLSLGICFACVGFLPYNLRLRRPAAVFMGDSGAQVLGFALASLGLTSLAYNVLDDTRITLAGVLITFAFLLQFGSYLADINRAPVESDATSFVRSLFVHRRRLVEVVVDFALIAASFTVAYLIRVEGKGTIWDRHLYNLSLPVVLIARYVFFVGFGLYRGVWRYAGARDAASIFAAVVLSECAAFAFLSATIDWREFPRGVFVIDALISVLLIGGSRFWERGVAHALGSLVGRGTQDRTLIVGAGKSGRSLLRELRETPGVRVVGFVDDDPAFRRRRIQGVPVVSSLDDIGWSLGRLSPDTVLVTIPEADRERLDGVVEACKRAGIQCRFVRRHIDLDPSAVLGATAE
jgi:UDP-GlcNAc:undecaprenyl-phosphate GlcNAc-1-phosphate transferase